MATTALPTINSTNQVQLSQAELLKRLDPNGNVADIAEILNETNEVLTDVVFKEGNLPNGHQATVRTGMPDIYWRQMGRGVPPSKSAVANITETCAMMAAMSKLDVKTAELNGNTAQYRTSESKPFIEAMGQAFARELFYGDKKKAEEGFTGIAQRYSSLTADNAKNIIDCGATSKSKKVTSIYIVGWGDNVFGLYPKGSKVGLETKDKGAILTNDEFGNEYEAYVTMYSWQVGLMVRDWRYIVRLANIDVDDLFNGTGMGSGDLKTGNNILTMLDLALTKIPKSNTGHLAMYMNSDVFAGLNVTAKRCNADVIAINTKSNEFGVQNAWGSYMGVPMRQCDQIVNTETLVK